MKLTLAKSKESKAKNFISTAYDFEKPLDDKKFYPKKLIIFDFPIKKMLLGKIRCFDIKKVKQNISRYKTIEEKIFSIFENDEILSGDKKFLIESKNFLLNKIHNQIHSKKPILFTLLQFPFKIPNPLKTERTLPDLGEIAYLYQLNQIAEQIKEIYARGAKFVILGESLVFRNISDISLGEALTYRDQSQLWIKKLGFQENIEIVELRDAEKLVSNFQNLLDSIELKIRRKYSENDKDTISLVSSAIPTLLLSLNVRNLPQDKLMNIFRSIGKETKVNKEEKEAIQELEKSVVNVAFRYLGYHLAIKESNLREKLRPNNIGVSPIAKPERFGVFPINKHNRLYPIHGVPVIRENGYVIIRYKIDVLRDKNVRYAYKIDYNNMRESLEKDPFFYSETKI